MYLNNKEISKLSKEFSKTVKKYQELGKIISNKFSSIQNELKQAIAPLIDEIKNLPAELKYSQKHYLFDNGWYIPFDIPIFKVKKIAELIRKKQIKELEVLLSHQATALIPEMKKKINKDFPHREKIINDALSAHEEKLFTLSIPIFLIQAEGICHEILETSPYFTRGKKGLNKIEKKIGKELSKYSVKGIKPKFDTLTNLFLNHLLNETEITKKTKRIRTKSQLINRQSIIHGGNINYPSEKNSLKAICFLNYIIWLKSIFEKINNFMKDISKSI